MYVVPVSGDKIKTKDGLPFKVLSYSNYKTEGPAVIVDSPGSKITDTVFFQDIAELNGQKVTYAKTGKAFKVFETPGAFERKFQLPQPGEFITSNISGVEPRKYEIQRICLHVKNQLSSGLLLDCLEKDQAQKVQIPLSQISDVDHYLFSREKFMAYYADYCEKGTA